VFREVALVKICHEDRKSFTVVSRLFSGFLKSSLEKFNVEPDLSSETLQSEKYRVKSSVEFSILSQE
jgi:hypothetical protein